MAQDDGTITTNLPSDVRSRARAYDRWFEQPWGRHAAAVERRALLRALGDVDGLRLIDVGCGTGRFARAFDEAGAEVTGVDRDPGMLAVAREHFGGALLCADAHDLPVRDDGFDLAVAVTLLEFAVRPSQVIAELARVTRPGGRVVIAALNPTSPWGVAHRRRLRRPPWSEACLLRRRELRALVAGRGPVTLHAALYAPGAFPGLGRIGPALERIGAAAPRLGAFQVAVLRLPTDDPEGR